MAKWEHRRIVAWDGEGANDADDTHFYNLLSNSLGSSLSNNVGLSTKSCLEFLIRHADPKAIHCIYGGSYDVNMMLVDLSLQQVSELWVKGTTIYQNYRLYYTPRKKFTVQKMFRKTNNKLGRVSITLWDVIGYFQCTFVKACRNWGVGDPELLDEIERMKYQRNVFTAERLPEIKEYNKQECDLLVELMEALFDSLEEAGIELQRYDGAGSIAAALLKKYRVKDHKGKVPNDVYRWSQIAYSGGRIEPPKVGNEICKIKRADINSAYPFSCLSLPSYEGAEWCKEDDWDGSDHSLVHLRYHFTEEAPFYPFWYRQHDGSILYPRWGEGIYFGSEARYPLSKFPADIEVLGAINPTITNYHKPFGFNVDTYAQRLMYKKAGSMAAESLKLGMNSEYGKTAQQLGGGNGPPTYHQLLWAGEITARTRALMYKTAMQDPSNIVAFATDAIITKGQLTVPEGKGLGEWTCDYFDGITLIQAGVYWLLGKDGEWSDKYRGFDKGSLQRDHIVNTWRMGFPTFSATLSRFIGMGSALSSTDFSGVWRTWPVATRELSLTPSGKRIPSDDHLYWDHLCDTIPETNCNIGVMSKPYPVEWMVWDSGSMALSDYANEVLLDEEMLDSYE